MIRPFKFVSMLLLSTALAGCGSDAPSPESTSPQASDHVTQPLIRPELPAQAVKNTVTTDKFTYANYNQVRLTHIDLNLDVNFDAKVLDGIATLDFERVDTASNLLVLDTKDLLIKSVRTFADGQAEGGTDYTLSEPDKVMGAKLSVPLTNKTTQVAIAYRTSPEAEGLQWLSPAQTAGKEKPYLFSQAQPIHARTMAPLQDTPAVRLTYSATLRVPDGVRPLMSAEQGEKDPFGEYYFSMPQPIPSYLIAIAVGDIKFKAISDTIGVYAEEYILDAAAEEFSETPMMETSNVKLYGPYRWGRYDLIVLPPSFPFGGMENPRLSFLTPTLVAGDKSLTNVVAHELAHSWSGNLVTNSNWRDAWLNEGFTSYVENRIMEDLYGTRRAVMEQALGLDDLKRDVAGAARPGLTQLKLPEDIMHPDDAFSQVAYVKGQFFLMFLEERFGRAAFDPFLKSWFNDHAFKSVTTEDFLMYLRDNLWVNNPDAITTAELEEWVYKPGLPSTIANPQSDAFDAVVSYLGYFMDGKKDITEIKAVSAAWSTHEWLHFINSMPMFLGNISTEHDIAKMTELDKAFALTGTQNAETAFAWYMQAIANDYSPAMPEIEKFLMSVGRGKFIYRLYAALNDNGKGDFARRVYANAREGYHPIAQRRIDAILK